MKRFGRVLKLDFAQGYKSILWGSLRMLLLYLFLFWFAHKTNSGTYDYYNLEGFLRRVIQAAAGFCDFSLSIFFLVVVSMMFRAEQKKENRVVLLMLPASNLEKFVSRWLYVLAYSVIGGVGMFFVADALHMLYLWATDSMVMSASPVFLDYIVPDRNTLTVINVYVATISVYTFFLLGGIFFKRNNFLICATLFVVFITVLVFNTINMPVYQSSQHFGTTYIFTIIHLCLIALFTWLSYRLFCRWQVVTHKYANI